MAKHRALPHEQHPLRKPTQLALAEARQDRAPQHRAVGPADLPREALHALPRRLRTAEEAVEAWRHDREGKD